MKTFFHVEDLGDLKAALAEAQEVKAQRKWMPAIAARAA